jgi:hypothetical protein
MDRQTKKKLILECVRRLQQQLDDAPQEPTVIPDTLRELVENTSTVSSYD